MNITIGFIQLSEAIPFLVATIGFEKPFVLTKAIFTAEDGGREMGVRERIRAGVQSVGGSLLADYAFEILMLSSGSYTGTWLSGLSPPTFPLIALYQVSPDSKNFVRWLD